MRIRRLEKEQVRKRGLPPPLLGWMSGGKLLFLTCSILDVSTLPDLFIFDRFISDRGRSQS